MTKLQGSTYFILKKKKKKSHLFVGKDDLPVAVQNGLEAEGSQSDAVLQVNMTPLNQQCSS